MTSPILSIIIVSYNTAELTIQTINSVLRSATQSQLLADRTQIIVVDNNSADDSVQQLLKLSRREPSITVLKNKTNLGFAKANNQGIKLAQGKYLLLLNSDTIVQNQAVQKLVDTFEATTADNPTADLSSYHGQLDRLGILAATLVNQDGTHQPQGGSFPSLLTVAIQMLLLDDLPLIGKYLPSTQHTGWGQSASLPKQTSKLIKKDWVGGTALMIRRQVLTEVGPLDENIFMYGEDTELCMRAADHHWDSAIHPTALVTHLGSASSSSRSALVGEFKAYQYIWSKHKPAWQRPVLTLLLWLGCYLRLLIFGTIKSDINKVKTYQHILTTL